MFCICAGSLQDVGVTDQTSILYEGIERQFSWKNFGFKLFLPSNALPPGVAECLITIEAIGEGQFKFPDDSEPVSGIYSISSPCTLQKPAVVETNTARYSKLLKSVLDLVLLLLDLQAYKKSCTDLVLRMVVISVLTIRMAAYRSPNSPCGQSCATSYLGLVCRGFIQLPCTTFVTGLTTGRCTL